MEGFNSGGGKPFKLPGHTLPGINQRMDKTNLEDGRPGSSALQFDAFQSEDKQKEIATQEAQANMEGDSAANYKSALHLNDPDTQPNDEEEQKTEQNMEVMAKQEEKERKTTSAKQTEEEETEQVKQK